MRRWVELCIARPIFASMMILALVVAGTASFIRLRVDRYPAVDVPTVSIRTTLAGASVEEIETLVSKRIEEGVNRVDGIDELRSISSPGSSAVMLTFDLDKDVDVAAQDVRDRLATVLKDLPRDVDPPIVAKIDNDQSPMLSVALSSQRSQRELTELADKVVKRALERKSGVGEVRIVGGINRVIDIRVDADRLAFYGLPVTAVRDAVDRQNTETPGGNVTGRRSEAPLRTIGRLEQAAQFRELVVAPSEGAPIRLKDVAEVDDGQAEARSFARINGEPCVVLEVLRQSGANTVQVIDEVKAELKSVQAELPGDVKLEILRDQSRHIHAALHEIEVHLVLGSILASLVVLVFMRSLRSMFIAALAIPTSVIATFSVMEGLGFTLNSVTMLSLVLMVGIVIDDAIVVLENVFRHVEEKGETPRVAASNGTSEIAMAVLATTFSLVVIFVPVSFMSSTSGRFLYQFGITAAAAVLVSLFVSFTLTPSLCARLIRKDDAGGHGDARSRRGFYSWLDRAYVALLRLSLRFRWAFLLLIAAVMWWTVPLYRSAKQEYVPSNVDESEFEVSVNGPEGLSIGAMDGVMRAVENELRQVHGVRLVEADAGGGFIGGVNQGQVFVRLVPVEERTFTPLRFVKGLLALDPGAAWRDNYTQGDVKLEARARLAKFKDLRCSVRNVQSFNFGTGPFEIDFALLGPDLDALSRYGEALRQKAIAAGGIVDVDTTLKLNKPELQAVIDRERAADLHLDASDVASSLRLMVGGDLRVSRYRDPLLDEDYDVRLRLKESDRSERERIESLVVAAADGSRVPLREVVKLEESNSPSRIDRTDRQRVVRVRAQIGPGYALADRLEALRQAAGEMNLPPGYSTKVTGKGRELERTFREFLIAFALSIVLMYLVLAAQFESLIHPITILLTVPLSLPFALFSLRFFDTTLNLYSALGILVLFGVIKKNAILQVDHTNQLRASGLDRDAAILKGSRERLRPILMTTIALVAGMLPLLLGRGPGAEERQAVAVIVVGGQTLSLLLTLLVTPVVYSIFDDFRRVPRPAAASPSESVEPA